MRRKIKSRILLSLATIFLLTGCSPIVNTVPEPTDIYATIYPLYAMTQRIAEGASNTEIHCLLQPQDDCLRTYSLSDWDLYMLAYSADAVISSGNGLENFQENLRTMGETVFPVAEVLQGLPMMQIDAVVQDEDSHFSGDIPHVYMSLEGAEAIAENIAGALSLFDAENASVYEANNETIHSELSKLRAEISKQTEVCTDVRAAILHEALIYPAAECGLTVAAAFERESGEMLYGSSLTECLETLRDHEIQLVLLEKQAPLALIKALSKAGFSVVQLDVLSSHQEKDGFAGYIDALAGNAKLIIEACNEISR